MVLYLQRSYFAQGTNGEISYGGHRLCACIELPWRQNKRGISCIPEGRYQLVLQQHHKHGLQLAVANVPQREGILIHPANFAIRELQGCIAPVVKCSGPGIGTYSRVALERLQNLVYPALAAGEMVYLVIKSVH